MSISANPCPAIDDHQHLNGGFVSQPPANLLAQCGVNRVRDEQFHGQQQHSEFGVVEVGALIGLSSVVLVMIIAQPRIFMIMSRDGLLPKVFNRVHPRYRTPHLNTIITGVGIAILAAVFPLDLLANLTSMGTLIAFVAVCAGVLILRYTAPDLPRSFRVPGAWFVCSAGVLSCCALLYTMEWFNWLLMIGWTVIGLAIYFGYGMRHSRLRRSSALKAVNE